MFDEEFDGPIAWGERWVGDSTSAFRYGDHNPGDDKLDWLSPSAVTVADGVATFTASPGTRTLENGRQSWTTGLLTTEGSAEDFMVRVGDYVETRVKLPSAAGAWPALWTWYNGTNEIDSFEYHPDNPDLLELTNGLRRVAFSYRNPAVVRPGDWVDIGVRYGQDCNDWYVDGVKVFSDNVGTGGGWAAYLILNLSVEAGRYHQPPADLTPFTYAADYVRVWR
ncbi:beta-glucanase [Kitasatospora sp. DSM 101779]|uniref:glycoside hydrolase family 16 protein n=1 Tax=Kitasatospora sp. DSM 101779 TaxID=2853165 RepID=UPI0021D82A3A|nr:beta-glucanase [Kitasatospora sp. DSM 101779]MCU7827058.1 beta-glucanase [Kitasatospora sp. DSM 101779]